MDLESQKKKEQTQQAYPPPPRGIPSPPPPLMACRHALPVAIYSRYSSSPVDFQASRLSWVVYKGGLEGPACEKPEKWTNQIKKLARNTMILSLKLTHFDIFTTIPMHTWTIDFLLAYSRMNWTVPTKLISALRGCVVEKKN